MTGDDPSRGDDRTDERRAEERPDDGSETADEGSTTTREESATTRERATTTDEYDDPILTRVLSDSAYDRVRVERFSHFKGPIPRKLTVNGILLGSLALLVPLYALYPESAAAYLPSLDPGAASPTIVFLGAFGAATQLGTATMLVGAALYRVRNEPLSESQAHEIFDAENFAAYFGFGTGGFAIAVTFAFFSLGLGGESTLAWYVQGIGGANPFRATGTAFSVGHLSAVALSGALVIAVARGYVATRLDGCRQ